MAKIKRTDDELPLSPPVLYILLALGDKKRHGYDIMKDVAERTNGTISLLPGSLYSTIQRMVVAGLIEESPGKAKVQSRRRYYSITQKGRKIARAEVDRMMTVVELAKEKALVLPKQVKGEA